MPIPYGFMDKVAELQRSFSEKRKTPYDRAFGKVRNILDYGEDVADTVRSNLEAYRERARIEKNRASMRMYIFTAGLCTAEEEFWRKMNSVNALSMGDCLDPDSPYSKEVSKTGELAGSDLNRRKKIYENP